MTTGPGRNLERLGAALLPFADADLVLLFRSAGAVDELRTALEEIAASDLVTLMIGADHGLTGSFVGAQGFVDAWVDYTETFKSLRSEITDLREVGPDVVYGETRQIGVTAPRAWRSSTDPPRSSGSRTGGCSRPNSTSTAAPHGGPSGSIPTAPPTSDYSSASSP